MKPSHRTTVMISLVWNPANITWQLFCNAVGDKGRGIGLITPQAAMKHASKHPDCDYQPDKLYDAVTALRAGVPAPRFHPR
jgi:hypothetical protein